MYIVQAFDGKGELLASSWPQLNLPLQPGMGFRDVEQEGRGWRTYVQPAASSDTHTVQVTQSASFRTKLAAERAGTSLAPVLILLPLSMLVLWLVARAMSAALQDIGRQAAQQDEHNIAELSLERVPEELTPLVRSFNALLRRLG